MLAILGSVLIAGVQWKHPAGLITRETIADIQRKLDTQPWARKVFEERKEKLAPWLEKSASELEAIFPKTRGNVYHNFSCPADRVRLDYDPFNATSFRCGTCGKTFPADTDAGIYSPEDPYHGTMYDGWACLFYLQTAGLAVDAGLIGRVEGDERYTRLAIELLSLFANTIEGLPTDRGGEGQFARILTYHREGDNKILYDLAVAFELTCEQMTAEQKAHVKTHALERLLKDGVYEPYYSYDHNNVYQWHRTIIQTALALEREDLIDWSFGYGAYSPERLPEHRSLRRIVATHFKPDGAFWELCSGYHLYPMFHFCELAVISHNLSRMDPQRFPPERYDYTQPASDGGRTIKAALEWFMAMAMPDRTMPSIGDSTAPRAGMDDYFVTAEAGYRYFGLEAVGDYARLRENRRWEALIFGADVMSRHETPYRSSCLSSGWVSLRNEWKGNRVWAGLNTLLPGGSHQHADRLTLVTYSHGQLLALEKATPYNERVTRVLGTETAMHNTVVVDRQSQKQGESLAGEEIPRVAYFWDGPMAKFAELHGDHIYPQTRVYRRSVAVVEDIIVDVFRVEGGETLDWMVHHAGAAPELSMEMIPCDFEPKEWLYNGRGEARGAMTDASWEARWQVGDVTSRLTMLGSGGAQVFQLETFPVDNAMITDTSPPCQTLCVRRKSPSVFIAVWDAWRDEPNLRRVETSAGAVGVRIETRDARYTLVFGPGEAAFADGTTVTGGAVFTVLSGDRREEVPVCGPARGMEPVTHP